MARILITGGAGFIGSALALRLANEGQEVVILDNLSEQIHGLDPEKTSGTFQRVQQMRFFKADVRDHHSVSKAMQQVDTVVHLAAETGTGQSMYSVPEYCDTNIQGTAILLSEILKCRDQVKKIVVASSRAIYGEGKYRCPEHGFIYPSMRTGEQLSRKKFNHRCPKCGLELLLVATSEDTPANPLSIYGITKLSQEQLVLNVGSSSGIAAIALRFQNVYGPGQSLSNPYTGILSIFSTRARLNKPISIFEDGEESRDFVYIDDVVESLCRAISSEGPGQVALNVGSGVSTSVNEVVKNVIDFFGSSSEVSITNEYRIGDIRHNYADLNRVKEVLKFSPKMCFSDGLKMFLEWVESQRNAVDGYERSLEELRARGLLK